MKSLHDYFNAGFDPLGLLPRSKDTREKAWNAPTRPRSATPYHDNGNIGLRTGVLGTAPNGVLVDSDDDVREAAIVSERLFPATGAICGRASKPRSHRFYVCSGEVPSAVQLKDLDGEMICELRTHQNGKALQTVVPPSVHESGEVVVLDTPTFAPSSAVSSVLVRFTYLKGTAVLLARHLTTSRGHDYRMALAGFLATLGFDESEMRETGLAIIELVGDGNEQDWRTLCRTTAGAKSVKCDIEQYLNDARVAQHLRAWFGVRAQQQRTITLRSLNTVQPQVTDWMWQDIVPVNHFGLHAGREGKGKSLSLLDLAAQLTRGTLPGIHHGTPKSVLITATEDDYASTIVPRLMAADADLSRVFAIEVTSGEHTADLSLPVDIDALKYTITDRGDVALLILDPLLSRLDGKLDTHKDSATRQALEPLERLAQDAQVTVLGIIHVNKADSSDVLNTIMGSRAFTAVARVVLATLQNPHDPSEMVLGQAKCNVGAAARTSMPYVIHEKTVGQASDGRDITAPYIEWRGVSQKSIHEWQQEATAKARGASAATRSHLAEDVQWLSDFLEAQPNWTAQYADISLAASKQQISEKRLRNAARELKVTIKRTLTVPSTTEWTLSVPAGIGPNANTPGVPF
jgi:hypothetical protein